ncbi:hypothetical protein EDD86DRAFT_243602 [Gorgonomyces haynaldii]|nr:hypothetical protein EDD86DRAFT_243602 [Gorgonomyces haynaldii]
MLNDDEIKEILAALTKIEILLQNEDLKLERIQKEYMTVVMLQKEEKSIDTKPDKHSSMVKIPSTAPSQPLPYGTLRRAVSLKQTSSASIAQEYDLGPEQIEVYAPIEGYQEFNLEAKTHRKPGPSKRMLIHGAKNRANAQPISESMSELETSDIPLKILDVEKMTIATDSSGSENRRNTSDRSESGSDSDSLSEVIVVKPDATRRNSAKRRPSRKIRKMSLFGVPEFKPSPLSPIRATPDIKIEHVEFPFNMNVSKGKSLDKIRSDAIIQMETPESSLKILPALVEKDSSPPLNVKPVNEHKDQVVVSVADSDVEKPVHIQIRSLSLDSRTKGNSSQGESEMDSPGDSDMSGAIIANTSGILKGIRIPVHSNQTTEELPGSFRSENSTEKKNPPQPGRKSSFLNVFGQTSGHSRSEIGSYNDSHQKGSFFDATKRMIEQIQATDSFRSVQEHPEPLKRRTSSILEKKKPRSKTKHKMDAEIQRVLQENAIQTRKTFIWGPHSRLLPLERRSFMFNPVCLPSELWVSFMTVFQFMIYLFIPIPICYPNRQEYAVAMSWLQFGTCCLDALVTSFTGIKESSHIEMSYITVQRKLWQSGFYTCLLIGGLPFGAIFEYLQVTSPYVRLIGFLNLIPYFVILMSSRVGVLGLLIKHLIRKYAINFTVITCTKILLHLNGCLMNFYFQVITKTRTDMDYVSAIVLDRFFAASRTWATDAPQMESEYVIRIFEIMFTTVVVAAYLGTIERHMVQLDSSGKAYSEKEAQFKYFLQSRQYPRGLSDQVMQYLDWKYEKHKSFDEKKILKELNTSLRREILITSRMSLIRSVPFFKNAEAGFVAQLVTEMEQMHLLEGDIIFSQDSVGDEMYFIAHGSVEVLTEGSVRVLLQRGSYFGEIALLLGKMKRTATVRCAENSKLFSLSRVRLDSALALYPSMRDKMTADAKKRLQELSELRQQNINIVVEKKKKAKKLDLEEADLIRRMKDAIHQ